ncbi:MAG: response regulator [Sedimentisphaerales bacterium]|nr:response regulator [Sedimentisphaerales bacterium]
MLKPILLVEDDRVYAILAKNVLKCLNVPNELIHAADGKEALDCLRNEDNPKPCLILLDLYMPRMNGLDFLQIVKSDPALKHIPVVVLTASPEEKDVAASFELGAAEYMRKEKGYSDIMFKMSRLMPYWSGVEVMPKSKHTDSGSITTFYADNPSCPPKVVTAEAAHRYPC